MHRWCRTIALGLAAFPAWLCAGTGQFLTRVWQTSEGLPHNATGSVIQTRDSYLWIASQSGLARFDGARFETFGVAEGLPDNRVLSLAEDRHATLWIGTGQGVARRVDGRIQRMAEGWPESAVWQLVEAGDGAIWLGTGREPLRSVGGGVPVPVGVGGGNPDVRGLLPDGPDGAMWILFRETLRRWEQGRLVENAAFSRLAGGRELFSLRRAADGTLWVAGSGLLARGTGDGSRWTDAGAGMPGQEELHLVAQPAADGTLWVASRNRGLCFLRDGVWRRLGVDEGLSHDDVRGISEDREGNLWVSTNGGGLNRLSEQGLEVFARTRGLGRQSTTALVRDRDGVVWAGTDGGGVLRLDGSVFRPGLPGGVLHDGFVWSLLWGRDGALWVGTFRHGLMRWKDGRADWLGRDQGLVGQWIPCLMEDRAGRIWIGTENGGVQKIECGRVVTLRGHPDSRGAPVVGMLEDRGGTVWVATAGDGLFRFRRGEAQQRLGPAEGLPDEVANALHEDDQGRLWIGTSSGLALRHPDGFHVWTAADGLLSNVIVQIQSEPDGHLWLGSDRGLQRLALRDGGKARPELVPLQVFSRPDGLPTPQCTGGHGRLCLREPGGALWFSLAAGAVRIDPASISRVSAPGGVHIESVTAGGEELWHFERAATPRVEVPPDAGSVTIRFTSPLLRAPEKLRFRHRIHGLDAAWQEGGAERSVTLGSLDPGHYRFEVMASNQEGGWSPGSASVAFRVRPHFWQTLPFRAAAGLAAALLIVVAARGWSLRRLRRKMELLEREGRLEKERSRIARDLHDDLGTRLTEINFLGSLGLSGAQSQATRDRLASIVDRAQGMAKSLDEIVWTVNPANDTVSNTANYLCSRAQESLGLAGIRCRLEVDDELPRVQLDSELRHHLLMAVNEGLNNLMKHSAANEARLRVGGGGGWLHVEIVDDGVGFDPQAVPPGRNGLGNIKRRLAAAGGRGEVTSAPGQGTRVSIRLPLVRAWKRPPARPKPA